MPMMLFSEHATLARHIKEEHPADHPATARQFGPHTVDDMVIGLALTTTWMLLTGRHLYERPLLHSLTAEQLVDFWADDHADAGKTSQPGTHTTRQPRRCAPTRPAHALACGIRHPLDRQLSSRKPEDSPFAQHQAR